MTDYYVNAAAADDTGSGSFSSPKKYLRSGSLLLASSSDRLLVYPGVYSNALDWMSSTIVGITIMGVDEPPVLSLSATNIFSTGAADQTIKNFVLRDVISTGYAFDLSKFGTIVEDVSMYNCAKPFLGRGTSSFEAERLIIINYTQVTAAGRQVYLDSVVTSSQIKNSIIDAALGMSVTAIQTYSVCDNVQINNSVISATSAIVSGHTTGTLEVNNSILQASETFLINALGVGGTTELNNCYRSPRYKGSGPNYKTGSGTVIINSDITSLPSMIAPGVGQGLLTLSVDWDNYNDADNMAMADLFAANGLEATFVINAYNFSTGGPNSTAAVDYVLSKGMSIGSHGWSHSALNDVLAKTAFTIYYTGTGTCTLTITGNRLTTTITGGAGEEELDIDLLDYINLYTNSGELSSVINRKTHYVAPWVGSDILNQGVRATSLADVSSVNISGVGNTYSVKTDPDRLCYDEIVENTKWVENTFGIDCTTYIYAGNYHNATTDALIAGMDGVSSGQKIKVVRADGEHDLSSVNPYLGLQAHPYTVISSIPDEYRMKMFFAIGEATVKNGALTHLYFHADDHYVNGDVNIQDMIDQIKAVPGLSIIAINDLITHLLANGYIHDVPTNKYNKAITSQYNYRPAANSGSLGAGISIPSIHEQATPATDLDGNIIHFLPPSIGPYDGQGDTLRTDVDVTKDEFEARGVDGNPAYIVPTVDSLAISIAGKYVVVKPGTKKVKSFASTDATSYLKGAGGSSGTFRSNFGSNFG